LYTAIPPTTYPIAALNDRLVIGDGTTDYCRTDGCKLVDIRDTTAITQPILNVTTPGDQTKVISWMYGDSGSVRQDRRLGDIYHSSPALVGAPKDEPADDAYSRFRSERPEVKERPLMMYISSNDGILHAISVEDYPVTGYTLTKHAGDGRLPLRGGQELWGFVPPMLLGSLKN
jgi:hypothetical protein